MDGTFYRGSRLLPGSADFLRVLEERGRRYLFFTNNSSRNREAYAEKLRRMGVAVPAGRIVTSGDVTADWLTRYHRDKSIFLVGTSFLRDQFAAAGLHLTEENADAVVVGFDTETTYARLTRACDMIREGSLFVATHPDRTCPTETGFVPDCGAVIAFIKAAAGGAEPKILGKPYRETLDYLLQYTGTAPEDMVFVGDRLYTDIAIGFRHGVDTVLVLTGETTREDLRAGDIQPDLITDRLADLACML